MVEARTPSDKVIKATGLATQISSIGFIQSLLLSCDVLPILTRMSKAFQLEDVDYGQVLEAVDRAKVELADLLEAKGEHEGQLQSFVEDTEEKVRKYAGTLEKKRAAGVKMNRGVGSLMEELRHFEVEREPNRRSKQYLEFPKMRKQYIAAVRDNLVARFPKTEMPVVVGLCKMFDPRQFPAASADFTSRNSFASDSLKTVLEFFGKPHGGQASIVNTQEVTSAWPSFVRVCSLASSSLLLKFIVFLFVGNGTAQVESGPAAGVRANETRSQAFSHDP